MNDFDYDCKQKKAIAASAFHRVGGSKSKSCSLPSDHMTQAQWKKQNGPVRTVKMGVPMTWVEFKDIHDLDLQKQYIKDLIDTYGASGTDLSKMFGVSQPTVTKWCQNNFVKLNGWRRSKEHAAIWESFCNGVVGGGESEKTETPTENVMDTTETPSNNVIPEEPKEEDPEEMDQTIFTQMTFERIPTQEDLASLRLFFAEKKVNVTISVHCG